MKLTTDEHYKIHAFDHYCKTVLRHEVIDIQREIKRQQENEITFSNLSEADFSQLAKMDDYPIEQSTFHIMNEKVSLKNNSSGAALHALSADKCEIILLSYFLELSDKEIGEILHLSRSTVQYRRVITLKELKTQLKEAD